MLDAPGEGVTAIGPAEAGSLQLSRCESAGGCEPLRLMAVHAHPDDESSKGAATMARYVREGIEVLVCTLATWWA